MTDRLPLPGDRSLAEEQLEQVSRLCELLTEPGSGTETKTSLARRRIAAERVAEIVPPDDTVVITLCPVLVGRLDEERRRLDRSATAADALLLEGISVTIQRSITDAISTAANSLLVQAYEESDRSLDSLLGTLAKTVIASDDDKTTLKALAGLCAVAQYRPDAVATVTAKQADTEYVLNLLARILSAKADQESSTFSGVNDQGSIAWWARLVAVVATRYPDPDSVPSTHLFRKIPDLLREADSDIAGVFGQLVEEQVTTLGEIDDTSRSTNSTVLDATRGRVRLGNVDAANLLGEVVAACPMAVESPPWSLVSHVRDFESREAAASALGVTVTTEAHAPTEQIQQLVVRAENDDLIGWRGTREPVGEVVAAHAPVVTVPAPVQPLVERVLAAKGLPRRDAALALSEAVLAGGGAETAVDPTPRLREYIRQDSHAEAAAKALGEAVLTMDPSATAVETPRYLQAYIQSHVGRSRGFSVQALGEAMATDDPTAVRATLVRQAHTGKGQVRWLAARTLGELAGIIAFESETTPWPAALIDRLRGADGPFRFERAELIGTAIAALEAKANDIGGIDRLITQILTRGGQSQYDSAATLGELVVADAASDWCHELLRPLVDQVTEATGLRRRQVVMTIGLVTALTAAVDAGVEVLQTLARHVQTTDGIPRFATAHALGEAVAIVEQPSATGGILQDAVTAVHHTDGRRRQALAHAVGELQAAVELPWTTADPYDALQTRVTASEEIDWAAAAAVGTLVGADRVSIQPPAALPAELIVRINGSTTYGRRTAAEAVGVAVVEQPSTYVKVAIKSRQRATHLPEIASTAMFEPPEFIRHLIDAHSSQGAQGVRSYLTAESDIRQHVFEAVREVAVRAEPGTLPSLRNDLERALTADERCPALLRLRIIEALSALGADSVAASQN